MDNSEMGKREEYVEYYYPTQQYGMCEREGYKYYYSFESEDDDVIIPDTKLDDYEPSIEKKVYSFRIETRFMLEKRGRLKEEMLGMEIYGACMHEYDGEDYLKGRLSCRLKAYGMPDSAIDSLVSGAIEFAKHCSVDDDDLLVIPVVMDLDVCTVQLERVTIDEAYGRAIRPECLMNLGKVRVEDVDRGLSLVETCPICLIDPTIGVLLSVLPCGHGFHNHCIWLTKSNSCPTCRLRFDSN